MKEDGFGILICVVVGVAALFLGFAMGVDSITQEIGKYGCAAVEKTWRLQP